MQKSTFTFILLAMVFASLPDLVNGQSYGTSGGLRLANTNQGRMLGLTVQQRLKKGLTIEGILQSDFNVNTTVHAIMQRHRSVISKRLNFYYGAGISMGIEESEERIPERMQIVKTYGNETLGVDLIGGVELTVLGINLSLDYKPNINITGKTPWYSGQVGISARSVLVKGSKQNKKRRKKARQQRRINQDGFFHQLIKPFKNNKE
jgi:hypothetical protein